MSVRSRNWCFTAFDPNRNAIWLTGLNASYIIYGEEVCPKSKKGHWQGYVEFASAKTFTAVTKAAPKGIHWEYRRGSQKQAIEYCMKDGEFTELGDKSQQGQYVYGPCMSEECQCQY